MSGLLDLVLAAILAILMAASTVATPVDRTTEDTQAMQQLAATLQLAVRTTEDTSLTTGSAGVDENDGVSIGISTTGQRTVLNVYPGRPLGSTTLGTPHLHVFNRPITVNGVTTAYGIFIAPNGSVSVLSGWTSGSSALSASTCSNVTFTTVTGATVTLNCATGAVSGP